MRGERHGDQSVIRLQGPFLTLPHSRANRRRTHSGLHSQQFQKGQLHSRDGEPLFQSGAEGDPATDSSPAIQEKKRAAELRGDPQHQASSGGEETGTGEDIEPIFEGIGTVQKLPIETLLPGEG